MAINIESVITPPQIVALNESLSMPRAVDPGELAIVSLRSSIESFHAFRDYELVLPDQLCDVIGELADEYDLAFSQELMSDHVESETDYMHIREADGQYSSLIYQIDMAGMPPDFLEAVASGQYSYADLTEIMRYRIFEFEGSAAMYNALRGLHSGLDEQGIPDVLSSFAQEFDAVLEDTRRTRGMGELVVGAVTDQKYEALLATELGINPSDPRIRDKAYIKAVTGFDGYFSPETMSDIDDATLVYARTSAPISAQKDPSSYDPLAVTLLADDVLRRELRARTVTLNVDSPHSGVNVNDTKRALPYVSPYSIAIHPSNFSKIDVDQVADQFGITGSGKVRFKPMEAYGAYRHGSGILQAVLKQGSRLENQTKKFGPYVLQPEIPEARITTEQGDYGYIHRVFVAKDVHGKFRVLGGFANYLPSTNDQARKNTYHGNGGAVWAPVTPETPRSQYNQPGYIIAGQNTG